MWKPCGTRLLSQKVNKRDLESDRERQGGGRDKWENKQTDGRKDERWQRVSQRACYWGRVLKEGHEDSHTNKEADKIQEDR